MNKTDIMDNYNVRTKKLTGMVFNGLFGQTIWEAQLENDWTGTIEDRVWAYTEEEAIERLGLKSPTRRTLENEKGGDQCMLS